MRTVTIVLCSLLLAVCQPVFAQFSYPGEPHRCGQERDALQQYERLARLRHELSDSQKQIAQLLAKKTPPEHHQDLLRLEAVIIKEMKRLPRLPSPPPPLSSDCVRLVPIVPRKEEPDCPWRVVIDRGGSVEIKTFACPRTVVPVPMSPMPTIRIEQGRDTEAFRT